MTADLQNRDPTRIHYLQKESEDLDAVFRSNYVRNHTFYETKKKALDNLALDGDEIVLDVGCGQGHLLKLLHRFYPNVTRIGIDINLKDLKKAKSRNNDKKCAFLLCDASNLPFIEKCFHGISATAVLEHVVSESDVLVEIRRTLRDDGMIVVDVPSAFHLQNKLSDLFTKKFKVFPFHREYTTNRMKTVAHKSDLDIVSFNSARFVGSLFFPVIETIGVLGGRKIVWCKGRSARMISDTNDKLTLAFGKMRFMKLFGGSWFFQMRKSKTSRRLGSHSSQNCTEIEREKPKERR